MEHPADVQERTARRELLNPGAALLPDVRNAAPTLFQAARAAQPQSYQERASAHQLVPIRNSVPQCYTARAGSSRSRTSLS
jgi:hypothetical protein